jgi:predicted flap endonuclease-1-like 5' DNA nuclease
MAKLEKLNGIGDKQLQRLRKAGVKDTDALLMWGSTPDGRSEMAAATKIGTRRIADWVHRADLMRLKGVDDDYARLLVRAGVSGVVDLSTRNPMELAEEVAIAAAVERMAKKTPREATLTNWIEQARLMVRHVWYHDTWGPASLTGRAPKKYQGPRYD